MAHFSQQKDEREVPSQEGIKSGTADTAGAVGSPNMKKSEDKGQDERGEDYQEGLSSISMCAPHSLLL